MADPSCTATVTTAATCCVGIPVHFCLPRAEALGGYLASVAVGSVSASLVTRSQENSSGSSAREVSVDLSITQDASVGSAGCTRADHDQDAKTDSSEKPTLSFCTSGSQSCGMKG